MRKQLRILLYTTSLYVICSGPAFAQEQREVVALEIEQLRSAGLAKGAAGILEALDAALALHPEYAASTDTASRLSAGVAGLLSERARGDALTADFAKASTAIMLAAPVNQRREISEAVTGIFIRQALAAQSAQPSDVMIAAAGSSERTSAQTSIVAQETDALRALGVDVQSAARDVAAERLERATRPTTDQTRPISIGSFLIYPDLTVAGLYDSNIFATRVQPVDDYVGIISPLVEVESSWSRHLLRFESGGELGRFAENTSEDYFDWWVEGEGRVDIGARHNIFVGAAYNRFHESRESPDDITGAEPTTFDSRTAYAGTTLGFGDVSLRVSGSYEGTDFDPVPTSTGVVDNASRDRQTYTGGARLTYRTAGGTQIYAQGSFDTRRYDAELDTAPFDRDSDGQRFIGGISFARSGAVSIELYGGYLRQAYDDDRFSTLSAPTFGAEIEWDAGPLTTVRLAVDRSILETTLDNSSGLLSTGAAFSIAHVLGDRWEINSVLNYRHGDYEGIDRRDEVVNASAGIKYLLSPHIYLESLASFRHLHSTTVFEDYDRNQILFRIGYQPFAAPARYQAWRLRPPAKPGAVDFGGFYGGIQAGYGALNTDVEGPRAELESVRSELGDSGAQWGLFAGFGTMFARHWYAGIEAEGETGSVRWTFDRGADIRQFSLHSRLSYGVAGRMGYAFADRAMFYARAGIIRSEFISRYLFGLVEVDEDHTKNALSMGGGLLYAIDDHLQVRFEAVLYDYDSFAINYDTGSDIFKNRTNSARFGMSYLF